MAETNGWFEKHVVSELARLNSNYEKISEEFAKFRHEEWGIYKDKTTEDIAALKVKAGLWGFIAGFIPALGVAIYVLFQGAGVR